MSPSLHTRLWRILAASMSIGAIGLGAYFYLLHLPQQEALAALHQQAETAALEGHEQSADDALPAEEQAAEEKTAAEQAAEQADGEANDTPVVLAYLPPNRLAHACENFREAIEAHPESHDAHASLFAIEELSRRAEFGDYSVQATEETMHDVVQDHRIGISMDGEGPVIERFLAHIERYEKAGAITAVELTRRVEDDADSRRRRRQSTPHFDAKVELRALAIPAQDTLALERCQALVPELP